jgi:peptidoglycan LD-endopeptidase CwlK
VTAARLADLDLLEREFRGRLAWLLVALRAEGVPLEVFETARSPERQAELYARGRDPDAVDYGRTVTRAMPWQSAHQFGLAADLVFKVAGRWTWSEPGPHMWSRLPDLAHKAGLVTLSFEMPHVQGIYEAGLRQLERGPNDTEAWLAWLRGRVGV